MKSIIIVILFAFALVLFSYAVNYLGRWSNKSVVGKVVSVLFFILLFLSLFRILFIEYSLGEFDVSLNNGKLIKVNSYNSKEKFELKSYVVRNGKMFIKDKRKNTYMLKIPVNISSDSVKLRFHSTEKVLFCYKYFIWKLSNFYLVITFLRIFEFISSFGLVFVVWGYGTENKMAIITLE